MRQSLAELEARFHHEAAEAVAEREAVQRETQARARIRRQKRVRKHGSLRFVALVVAILATSLAVTFLMFEALALLIG